MIRINRTVPDRNRGTGNSVDAEQLEPDRGRDYIDDRVDRPDLVKMYVSELHAVDLRSFHPRMLRAPPRADCSSCGDLSAEVAEAPTP